MPVIGLVQVGSQAMADRYSYIPSIGLFMAFVWAVSPTRIRTVSEDASSIPRSRFGRVSGSGAVVDRRLVLAGAGYAILAVLLVATWRQASYWITSERLFRHALAITGENPVDCESLGDALLHQERYAEAEAPFRRVLAMDSEHFLQTPPELAQALAGQGRIGDAIALLDEAIPDKVKRAMAMDKSSHVPCPRRRVPEAIRLLQAAIELTPQEAVPPRHLAWIYATCPDRRFRNGPKAVELARRACELSQWNDAQCRQTLADAYLEAGDTDRAVEELRAVVRLDPTDREAAEKLQSLLRRK